MAPRTNDSTGDDERATAPPASGHEETPDAPRPPTGDGPPAGAPEEGHAPEPRQERPNAHGAATKHEPKAARDTETTGRTQTENEPETGRHAEPEREPETGHGTETGRGTGAADRVPGEDDRVPGEDEAKAARHTRAEHAPGVGHRPKVEHGPGPGPGHRVPGGDPAASADEGRAGPRFAAAARRGRGLHVASCAVLLAVAITAGSVAVGGGRDEGRAGAADVAPAAVAGVLGGGDLGAGIRSLQGHLRAQPRDFGGWATLGTAYVEQARTQGDPSRYPQAERALERSLALAPGNEQALAGQAALAAARHDFTGALKYADRALKQNPYSERALCSRIDALVELGRYEEAAGAAATADRRRPGVPVFTRYAYVRELRGDVRTAREVLRRALDSASSPADVAYVATALGRLAWNQGEYETALTHYARALAADDGYLPALEGRARAQAASGDRAGAVETLEQVVGRSPLPGPLVALGELYEDRGADGDRAKAHDQYALVDAWTALARAGGVDADLDTALAAADHGDAGEALRAARAEWDRRHSVHTADALAWALHVNGRDEEALPYARRATATGYRDAAFLYHRGMIEKATGHDRAARGSLTAALELNPGFSPLGARAARTALKELEAAR
ncbi:tetratricopeptide repeat protein [Streptomyces sp. CB02400]|uniref:tetratricopeptide repeat protein n=1 Tax=Streptomyces sp. CB02400 TaxID=1703944 RepID=UPI000AF9E02B|nr:tetratricopeptide repeat protein [Streptomyces sp. CB02400]